MRWVEQRLMMRALIVVVACGLGVLACTRPNPAYCASSDDCGADKTCDLTTHTCVAVGDMPDAGAACSTNDGCPKTAPVCGSDSVCRACALDDECASGVCANDGSCELPERILYVAPNAPAAGSCEQATPCDIYYAKSIVTGDRHTIRLANGLYAMTADFIIDAAIQKLVIVGGRAATVQRTSNGPAFEVQAAELHLRGLTLNKGVRCLNSTMTLIAVLFENPPAEVRPWIEAPGCTVGLQDSHLRNSTGIGISGDGSLMVSGTRIEDGASHGIQADSAQVVITKTQIARNAGIGITTQGSALTVSASIVLQNLGGGIKNTYGTFNITNNAIRHNGDPGVSGFGGLLLDSPNANNRLQHNTIIRNDCDVNVMPILAGGVYCKGASAPNNIIANNFRGNTSLPNAQVGGTCDFGNSVVAEGDLDLVLAADGIHLSTGSSAIDKGTPGPVTVDMDGQSRSDGKPDLGADELTP